MKGKFIAELIRGGRVVSRYEMECEIVADGLAARRDITFPDPVMVLAGDTFRVTPAPTEETADEPFLVSPAPTTAFPGS